MGLRGGLLGWLLGRGRLSCCKGVWDCGVVEVLVGKGGMIMGLE